MTPGPVLVTRQESVSDRLDRLEARISAAEAAQQTIPELSRRIDDHDGRLNAIRSALDSIEHRVAGDVARIESGMEEMRTGIPAMVESAVARQLAGVEARLSQEAAENWNRSLAHFESTIERKMDERLDTLESVLAEQSASIRALRNRAEETDSNLQRLVSAVEKICERGIASAPSAVSPERATAPARHPESP
jgi:uncharacterized coiled-coil protein SlyX